MKLLFGAILFFSCTFAYGQQRVYSYSFSGVMDSSFVEQLQSETMEVEGVNAAKAKYKVEKKRGEIIIYTSEAKNEKDPFVFSPSSVKAIFIRHELDPGQFIQLKTSK